MYELSYSHLIIATRSNTYLLIVIIYTSANLGKLEIKITCNARKNFAHLRCENKWLDRIKGIVSLIKPGARRPKAGARLVF